MGYLDASVGMAQFRVSSKPKKPTYEIFWKQIDADPFSTDLHGVQSARNPCKIYPWRQL